MTYTKSNMASLQSLVLYYHYSSCFKRYDMKYE